MAFADLSPDVRFWIVGAVILVAGIILEAWVVRQTKNTFIIFIVPMAMLFLATVWWDRIKQQNKVI